MAVAEEARIVVSASVVAEQPMNFVLVEGTPCSNKGVCPRWIAGEGGIQADTPARFEEMLGRLGGEKLPLFLNSQGGSYEAAMQLGALVAAHHLSVAVAATAYPGCQEIYLLCRQVEGRLAVAQGRVVDGRGKCDFACVFVLAAAEKRVVPADLSLQMPVLRLEDAPAGAGFILMTAEETPDLLARMSAYVQEYGLNQGDDHRILLPMPKAGSATELLPLPPAAEPQAAVRAVDEVIVSASLGPDRPMDFVLLERADCSGQRICQRWVSAEGLITAETPGQFRRFLKRAGAKGLPLMLNSGGGDYAAGMALGRLARAAHLKTGIGRAAIKGCDADGACRAAGPVGVPRAAELMEKEGRCDLACVFFLAGGDERRMPADGHVIMPKLRLGDKEMAAARSAGVRLTIVSADGSIGSKVQAFLDDMGMYKTLFAYGINSRTKLLEPVRQGDSSQFNLVSSLKVPAGLLNSDAPPAAAPAVALVTAPEKPRPPARPALSDMRFYVVTTPEAECDGDCKSWITGVGEITRKSPASFRKVLKSLGKRRLPVILHSPGGSVEAALEIGRMIRQRKLSVAIGNTYLDDCNGTIGDCASALPAGQTLKGRVVATGAYCLSACPLLFAGGVERVSSAFSFLGVHQITTVRQIYKIKYSTSYRIENGKRRDVRRREVGRTLQGTDTTTDMTKGFRKRLLNYLAEMGIEAALMDRMREASPSDMRYLSENEAIGLNLITGPGNARDLVAGQ